MSDGRRMSGLDAEALQFEAAEELLHDAKVEILAEVAVLDAGIDRRVVVHLDHHGLVADLLEVHAVETVTNGLRRFQRQLDDIRGRLAHGYRTKATGFRRALGTVVVDLPVATRH